MQVKNALSLSMITHSGLQLDGPNLGQGSMWLMSWMILKIYLLSLHLEVTTASMEVKCLFSRITLIGLAARWTLSGLGVHLTNILYELENGPPQPPFIGHACLCGGQNCMSWKMGHLNLDLKVMLTSAG